ncbi:MAG: BamA/TamA family outer membrane protein [Gammaproteobacteria bacterium]|nr:BamA/TamA family outer membrane protein [Gammaproteobacteria bacterium]
MLSMALLHFSGSLMADNIFNTTPDRRTEQFPTDSGHLVVPLPYSMPGIGEGYFFMGYFSNIFKSTADAFIVKVEGDAEGFVTQLDEVPLYKKNLFFNLLDQKIDKAAVNNYKTRGMANGKDDFNIIEVNQADESALGLTLSGFQRRLEFTSTFHRSQASVVALHNSSGELITRLAQPYKSDSESWVHTLRFDMTDDNLDPRRGFRYKLHYQDVSGDSSNDPDYYRLDNSLSLYIPMLKTIPWQLTTISLMPTSEKSVILTRQQFARSWEPDAH